MSKKFDPREDVTEVAKKPEDDRPYEVDSPERPLSAHAGLGEGPLDQDPHAPAKP